MGPPVTIVGVTDAVFLVFVGQQTGPTRGKEPRALTRSGCESATSPTLRYGANWSKNI